jgi:hypothetical protein
MKQLAQELLAVVAFSAQMSSDIVDYLERLPLTQWYHRLKINSKPTKGDPSADYWFMGDRQMPKDLYTHLLDLAPTIDGAKPDEICLNRYEIGNGMPEHIDIAMYRHNMVIPLSDHGDGLLVGDQFYVDQPGQGLIMPFKSPPHEVPPVKHRRYTLIYLYE